MKTLLIANRGEIAVRIARTAKALGLNTVAVYSDADARAVHVEVADAAVHIGPASARESYLDGERIIAAARESGADAIHPGYGFLSENAEFARHVIEAGLIWIGPAPDVIQTMGDKQLAREIARAAGVPVVPGSRRFAEGDLGDLHGAADAIGYPLLAKASAGGGGIGMRRVDEPTTLLQAVAGTQSMAARAFGDGSVFLERYLPTARHVEIQVFGFGDGRAIHLFERDCSLQRRFQKVIEESPAPGLPEAVRSEMAEAAVALCRQTRYGGAGTVEFIVDAERFDFFFLEMNTRIQVEHPVTEMITGRDLVAMQIEFARGSLAPIQQAEITRRGAAIECRLYAERPTKMFMPSPGPLDVFWAPPTSEGLRIDTGYRQGDSLTHFYDPMIAKIIVHGTHREEARCRAIEALSALDVQGTSTNREFLIACLSDESFVRGDVYTALIDDRRQELVTSAAAP